MTKKKIAVAITSIVMIALVIAWFVPAGIMWLPSGSIVKLDFKNYVSGSFDPQTGEMRSSQEIMVRPPT